jgi:hypothetical protein
MTVLHQISPWVYVLLGWGGGIIATVIGSWIASKIRVYHDLRQRHQEELTTKVLRPLRDALEDNLALFSHKKPVVLEDWSRLSLAGTVRADQDDVLYGSILKSVNPWPETFNGIDRALFEDAKAAHFKNLISEVSALVAAWEAHSLRCLTWVARIATAILEASKMNPYQPPYTPPYVLHLRLGIFVYRRLFHLPNEALRKNRQEQFCSIEGATTVPNVTGVAGVAEETRVDELLQSIDRIIAANRERAAQLQAESRDIRAQAVDLRGKLEFAIAKKKLRKRCDLVPY